MKRVFYNPQIKDKVTVLRNAEDTNGDHLLVEVELAPGGGTPLHYHHSFNEKFIPVNGELGVDVAGNHYRLTNGEEATARMMKVHRFYNPGKEPIRFQVKIFPAATHFLQSLCIGYGLADDGLCNKKGIPKKLDHIALLTTLGDTNLTGFFSLIQPVLKWRARRARLRGELDRLIEKYCSDEDEEINIDAKKVYAGLINDSKIF